MEFESLGARPLKAAFAQHGLNQDMACTKTMRAQTRKSLPMAIAALRGSLDTNDWEQAASILSSLHGSSVQHDQRSFSIGVKASGRAEAWEVSCCIVAWMARVGLCLDSIAFSTATAAIGHRWKLAISLYDLMSRHLVRTDAVNFGCSMGSCQQALQWSAALVLLMNTTIVATAANAIITGSLISACGAVWKEALAVFDSMWTREA